ncbi:hypothetical protein STEG23_003010, partial [Scotinomys teguina]
MGGQQCKNTFNSIKSNTAPPETSASTTARTEHLNADEAEENDLKNNFMKMTQAFKEEMKNSLKERQVKDLYEKIFKSLKKETEEDIRKWKDLPCSWIDEKPKVKLYLALGSAAPQELCKPVDSALTTSCHRSPG